MERQLGFEEMLRGETYGAELLKECGEAADVGDKLSFDLG